MNSNLDYYKVLGLTRNATQDEVKKAYKSMVLKYHPDRNQNDKANAEQKIKEVNQAYEVLSDPGKRSQYDQFGNAAAYQSASQGGGAGGFGAGFQDFGVDLGDLFGEFGDIFGVGKSRKRNNREPGSDLKYKVSISLQEAFHGKDERIRFTALSSCTTCNSTGSADGKTRRCEKCNGRGRYQVQQGFFIMEKVCGNCEGYGECISNPCRVCFGSGRVKKERELQFHIPAGIADGVSIKLSGNGEAGERGGITGDLYIAVEVKKDPVMDRDGNDLLLKLKVPFTTMVLGGKVDVSTIEEKTIELTIPPGTPSEEKFKVKNKGMPVLKSGGRRGDLYIIVRPEIPTNVTGEQKSLLEALHKTLDKKQQGNNFFEKVTSIFN
jgi:molecular chaperone DnaJ